jgi:hypothetical protein
MEIGEPKLVVNITKGREHVYSVEGTQVAIEELSRSLTESLTKKSDLSVGRARICGAPVLSGNGRRNEAYLEFWIDDAAISKAKQQQKGLQGFWADSGGCLMHMVLFALAGKGVLSFFS